MSHSSRRPPRRGRLDHTDQLLRQQDLFLHVQSRVLRRYMKHLSLEQFAAWECAITLREARYVAPSDRRNGGDVWMVELEGAPVFVIFRDDAIRTALPPAPFARLVAEQDELAELDLTTP